MLLANAQAPRGQMNVPDFQREAVAIATRLLHLTGPEPDLTTSPSTWGKYTGHYVARFCNYDVSLSADHKLQITCPYWRDQPVETMTQGGGYAWGAGDTFVFYDPSIVASRMVTFYAGSGGGDKMQYLLDSGALGSSWLLAKRKE